MINEQNLTTYWSNSARGFFEKSMHAENLPADCVEITQEEHKDWLEKQSIGYEIVPTSGMGKPNLVDKRPSPTEIETLKMRFKRNDFLVRYVDRVNQVRWNMLTTEQQAFLTEYRLQLLAVPQQPGFPFDIIWPTEPDFIS